MGEHAQAIAAGQRGLALATAGGDVILQALAHQYLGIAYHRQGDNRRAIDCLKQAAAFFDGGRRSERFGQAQMPAVLSRTALAGCHAELGMFAESRALGEEGLRIAEEVNHPASLMEALRVVGRLALLQGDLPTALPLLERALDLCQEADFPAMFPGTAVVLGAAYTLAGRVADAVLLLTQAMEQTAALERVDLPVPCLLSLGEAHLLAGHPEKALALAKQALALTRAHQERSHEAYALRLLGEIAAHRALPDVGEAAAHYRQALALAAELRMRPLVAHCHLGLGVLYQRLGKREPARAALSTAIELLRVMEMTFWLPRAEAALAKVA
jgi:tetratricopeptide (TPR) repeat protein